jgi:hypothetical protein
VDADASRSELRRLGGDRHLQNILFLFDGARHASVSGSAERVSNFSILARTFRPILALTDSGGGHQLPRTQVLIVGKAGRRVAARDKPPVVSAAPSTTFRGEFF